MTRQVKKPNIRKNEILDTARKFFFRNGYDQTSIQDIIDDLGIAKGTFYHYFTSKTDLLNKLTDRTTNEIYSSLKPIVESDMDAIEKFNKLFIAATAVKVANIDVMVIMLKVLFKDENTIIREKMYRNAVIKTTPLYTDIIKQGIKQGFFDTQFPEDTAEIIVQLGTRWNETICRILLRKHDDPQELTQLLVNKIKVYQDAIEGILGAPKGSIKIYVPGEYESIVKKFHEKLKEEK